MKRYEVGTFDNDANYTALKETTVYSDAMDAYATACAMVELGILHQAIVFDMTYKVRSIASFFEWEK